MSGRNTETYCKRPASRAFLLKASVSPCAWRLAAFLAWFFAVLSHGLRAMTWNRFGQQCLLRDCVYWWFSLFRRRYAEQPRANRRGVAFYFALTAPIFTFRSFFFRRSAALLVTDGGGRISPGLCGAGTDGYSVGPPTPDRKTRPLSALRSRPFRVESLSTCRDHRSDDGAKTRAAIRHPLIGRQSQSGIVYSCLRLLAR